ncbi:MAG: hypothetical protein OER91_12900 [Gammaproteobacteria bacterium]|nr:hypothetical protein [Gammaproteobacteria bacterium]
MLLRNIALAFRRQDWATVVVEFLIVVAGIFVGLQADSWSAERSDRERERIILEQLHSDFTANAASVSQYADRHVKTAEELKFALDILTRGELANADAARFRNAFISMYQMPGINATMGAYETLIASGDLTLLTDQHLKARLAQLSANVDDEANLLQYFREMVLRNQQLTRDHVLLVPNEDRTDSNLRVDFDGIKNDYRILLVVADQRRTHQIFGRARRGLADEFADTAAYIGALITVSPQSGTAAAK